MKMIKFRFYPVGNMEHGRSLNRIRMVCWKEHSGSLCREWPVTERLEQGIDPQLSRDPREGWQAWNKVGATPRFRPTATALWCLIN